jgi:hypothetical protein
MQNGTVGGGASANALATSHPRVMRPSDAVMAQKSRCAGCSTHAAYVSAIVTAFPYLCPPLHVPLAFSTSSRLFGSILCKYVQTQGGTTVSWSGGLGRGWPNISCVSYLVSWPHSCFRHLGHLHVSISFCHDSLGIASPLMTASSIASADVGGHAHASSSPVRLMFSFCRHWSSPDLMA